MTKGKKFYDRWNSNNTLFAFWIGCNDIRNIIRYPFTFMAFDRIITIMFLNFNYLYNDGARNFIILNIPPLDKAPLNNSGIYNYYKDDVLFFNNAYIQHAKKFYEEHPDINIIVYNTKEEFEYVMENYKEFNLDNANLKWSANKTADLEGYFWIDRSHLSYTGNKILAEDIHDLLSSLNEE